MEKVKPNEKSQCTECVFFHEENNSCIAYPNGIPNKYLNGEAKHETPDNEQVVPAVFERKPIEY